MDEHTKTALDDILAKHEERKKEQEAQQGRKESEANQFLEAFLRCQEDVIRPAMEEMGTYLEGKGYSYSITTDDEHINDDKRAVPASIRFTIYREGRPGFAEYLHPGLSAICDKHRKLINFYASTMHPGGGGSSGSEGSYPLEQVTSDLVQKMIAGIISKVFAAPWKA